MNKQTIIQQIEDYEHLAANPTVAKAAEILRGGGLVAIPTETVYGLAADATNPAAVRCIFEAKGRPQDNPLIVHVSSREMLLRTVTYVPANARKLIAAFWPGPLTIIMQKAPHIPAQTSAGLDTVGVRMPAHPVALAIIEAAGVPLAAPSANLSGKPSTTTAEHCVEDLTGRVEMIVDAGACQYGLESTVLSLVGEHPVLLRPGAVSYEEIKQILPDAVLHPSAVAELAENEKNISPGLKYRHYSPNAKVILVNGSFAGFQAYFARHADAGSYALVFRGEGKNLGTTQVIEYGAADNALEQAETLFSALRCFDELGAEQVFVRCPAKKGVGLAVYNRLLRAAGFEERYTDE